MSLVEASDAPSPSSDSVQYLYGTDPAQDGEVVTSGVRENPLTIDPEEPGFVDYEASEEYPNFLEDESGMPKSPEGNRGEGSNGGRIDGTLTGRGPSPPKNEVDSPTAGPNQTSQIAPNPGTEQSLRNNVAIL